ncbi:hypothetical protein FGO68_gene9082 [Halteria grandinella]|uniref:2,4-diaminopentanoate dehydrogenase C-terminal domain-containing protein n=1 Tax=Halteria grandinella TaxID=5974 RepID=A0A8J8T241_HALGN|nr:hypothetical protein FGO68_gene9082 [Halteria grandinella]
MLPKKSYQIHIYLYIQQKILQLMQASTGTRVALWGFGGMNKIVLSYLLEKELQVVAVIGHHDVGSDAGTIAGLEAPLGVKITHPENAKEVFAEAHPNVAILATRSFLKDLEGPLRACAESKVNVITIGEEAFYSWNTEPKLTQELDALFRQNSVTFTGTGYQDAYWLYLASALVGVSLTVNRLVCHTQFNVDDYGMALCEAHGVGLTPEEFSAKFTPENSVPAYVWNSNEALAVRLGWKILKTSQVYQPIVATKDIHSKTLGGVLPIGKVTGLKAIVTTTAENQKGKVVEIETHQIGQVYYEDLEDYCQWSTHGTPSLEISCKKPDTVGITCASAVNRIQSVIAARPGYVTVNELGALI